MSANLILFTMLIYFYIGIEQWWQYNNAGMGITYLAYGVANIGLYMVASK